MKKGLLSYVKNSNMQLLVGAGKDANWYREKVAQLKICLTQHDCDHSTCAHHKANCPPSAAIIVTCPFHKDILCGFLDKLIASADKLIDPELGRVHNNRMEIGFAHVWLWCDKRQKISCLRFKSFAGMGLLHSNQTAMFQIRGPRYNAMDEVAKRLGMIPTKEMREHSLKLALTRKRKNDRANSKEGRIKRSMARRRSQMEGAARKKVSKLIKKKLNLDHLGTSHRSEGAKSKPTLTEGVDVPAASVEEDDDSDTDDENRPGLVRIAKFQPLSAPKINRLLLVLDINETLLFNEWSNGKYTDLKFRPLLSKFLPWLKTLGVHIGLWTGSPSQTRQRYLAELLEPHGLTKDDLIMSWGAWNVCTTTKYYQHKPGKRIVVKPMSLLKQTLQGQYEHALLVDNDLEKSLGTSQRYVDGVPVANANSKFMNDDEEHLELRPYDGKDDDDDELDPVLGDGARRLFNRIRSLQMKYELDMK